MKVEAVLDAYPDWRIPAHVITTIPSADRQKATVKVRIGFDELDPRILPDMGVKVSFLRDAAGGGQAPVAPRVLVPKAAVRSSDGTGVVFVLNDDRVERRAVSVGLENGDQVEVMSGVSAGERVVVDGPADAQGRRQGEGATVQDAMSMATPSYGPRSPQGVPARRPAHRRPAGRQPRDPRGGFPRADGPVRLRQDDAAQPDRRPRHADAKGRSTVGGRSHRQAVGRRSCRRGARGTSASSSSSTTCCRC